MDNQGDHVRHMSHRLSEKGILKMNRTYAAPVVGEVANLASGAKYAGSHRKLRKSYSITFSRNLARFLDMIHQ